MKARRRVPRRAQLAAPLVMTAMLGAACGGREYTNPERPTEPTTQPVDTTSPDATTAPTTTASAPLAEIPKDENGRVEKQSDGTCLYIFPEPSYECPPEVDCNPGPPREPKPVKCPPDAKKGP